MDLPQAYSLGSNMILFKCSTCKRQHAGCKQTSCHILLASLICLFGTLEENSTVHMIFAEARWKSFIIAHSNYWAALQLETSLCFSTVFCNTASSVIVLYFDNTNRRGQWVSGRKEVRLHCVHNWNPPESQLTMIPWQAACWRTGASFGPSCHEIQYQSPLNGTMVLQISVRPPKGCTCHKT